MLVAARCRSRRTIKTLPFVGQCRRRRIRRPRPGGSRVPCRSLSLLQSQVERRRCGVGIPATAGSSPRRSSIPPLLAVTVTSAFPGTLPRMLDDEARAAEVAKSHNTVVGVPPKAGGGMSQRRQPRWFWSGNRRDGGSSPCPPSKPSKIAFWRAGSCRPPDRSPCCRLVTASSSSQMIGRKAPPDLKSSRGAPPVGIDQRARIVGNRHVRVRPDATLLRQLLRSQALRVVRSDNDRASAPSSALNKASVVIRYKIPSVIPPPGSHAKRHGQGRKFRKPAQRC